MAGKRVDNLAGCWADDLAGLSGERSVACLEVARAEKKAEKKAVCSALRLVVLTAGEKVAHWGGS
jgi:hypothetical protein